MPLLTELPEPSWTQSDNNLLPQWRKYLDWHHRNYGTDELTDSRQLLGHLKADSKYYTDMIAEQKQKIADATTQRNEYLNTEELNDDAIMAEYERLIASPHVVGTAIGMFGELRVLIDPQVEGHEQTEFGIFELAYRQTRASVTLYQTKYYRETYSGLAYAYPCDQTRFGGHMIPYYNIDAGLNFEAAIRKYDFRTIVDTVVESVFQNRARNFATTKDANRTLDWSGHNVLDPVSALKAFLDRCELKNAAYYVDQLTDKIEQCKRIIGEYNDGLRSTRKKIRETEAQIAKLEASLEKGGPSEDEMTETLRKITTMPGVIAVRFTDRGIPVLHVRNSHVRDGKRYDLGDYEIFLELHEPHFGRGFIVKQTRSAAGGDYQAGWHPRYGFCFGDRRESILTAFLEGDMVHAINLTLATMNTIVEDDLNYRPFAEIPRDMVWNRQIRRRPRRRSKVINAMGATALAAAS